ncbi:MAG: ATP-binding protein [Candidatus Omnitrophota bacterium]
MTKKTKPKLKGKPRILKKKGKINAKTPFRDRRVRDIEKEHLEMMVSDLSITRNHLEHEVQLKNKEIKTKNGQIKKGTDKQHRSEEQLHLRAKAMEATLDGIFIIDHQKQDFPVIYANHSFQKMTGYEKREIIGQNYFLLYGSGVDNRIIEEIKDTMQKGKVFHGEMLNFKKNGKKSWDSLRIAPVYDHSGCITHYVGIQTDITLMRENELEIDEQREELLHVTRVGKLAEFVSSLAHEISQPLTAILSYTQAAKRMLSGREPELQKILSYIISDNNRAAAVIQRLRSLLKKSRSAMKPLDINTLITDTRVLIATDATVRNIFLKLEFEDDLPLVRGDAIQLQQVLLNLISNSFDAMEKGIDPREILIRTSRKNTRTIEVAVKDSGCGIPEQDMPKLFDHFFTSKPDGLGMGLSISRSIVEAHGGRFEVENNPDRGATFCFTLPVDVKDKK